MQYEEVPQNMLPKELFVHYSPSASGFSSGFYSSGFSSSGFCSESGDFPPSGFSSGGVRVFALPGSDVPPSEFSSGAA